MTVIGQEKKEFPAYRVQLCEAEKRLYDHSKCLNRQEREDLRKLIMEAQDTLYEDFPK